MGVANTHPIIASNLTVWLIYCARASNLDSHDGGLNVEYSTA